MDEKEARLDEEKIDRREFIKSCTKIIGVTTILSVGIFQGCDNDKKSLLRTNGYSDGY